MLRFFNTDVLKDRFTVICQCRFQVERMFHTIAAFSEKAGKVFREILDRTEQSVGGRPAEPASARLLHDPAPVLDLNIIFWCSKSFSQFFKLLGEEVIARPARGANPAGFMFEKGSVMMQDPEKVSLSVE